jgi:sirohydrochlorin cobaltochelatase
MRKNLKKLFILGLAAGLAPIRADQRTPAMRTDVGVLVMAHGGQPLWNAQVEKAVREASLEAPHETFFGMAVSREERDALGRAIARLRAAGARKIVAVPLLVSSYSEVYRQYGYILGLRTEPGFDEEALRLMAAMHGGHGSHASQDSILPAAVPEDVTVTLLEALDDSPEVAEVLADRARRLSRSPQRERVVLVAHGPNGEDDERLWIERLNRLGQRLRTAHGFRDVVAVTLREDAPPKIRDRATRAFRTAVTGPGDGSETLVIPLLLSAGGIEKGIPTRLEGLRYRLGDPLLYHPSVSRWIERRVRDAAQTGA